MRRNSILLILLTVLPLLAIAQSDVPSKSHPHRTADRLGMSCDQILNMTSSDWTAYFLDKSQTAAPASVAADTATRAISAYGKCYDARTDALAASVARRGKGPLMGARGGFNDFEVALKDFTAQAFAASNPSPDATKRAYAALYEKQFRYAFYQSYATKLEPAAKPPTSTSSVSAKSAASPAQPSGTDNSSSHKDDAGPLTKAKNYFGGLLGEFPDDKMHELHAAFGKVLENYATDPSTQLAVYRYAIFVLERPTAKPFSPPPF